VSYQHIHPAGVQQWARSMQPRDRDEDHRVSTPLELFFDLVFVVAVAQAANSLVRALADGAVAAPVAKYFVVFFGIWWAWMGFSWFASAYDTEDIAYRLVVFVQMTGALILAAGIPRAFDKLDFGVAVLGYVVMRLGQVIHWLRVAAHAESAARTCALRFALGITACQIGWIVRLAVPGAWGVAGLLALGVAELLVPVWAERASATAWHPGHIVERYGLFTIIVLGESILAGSVAIQAVLDEGGLDAELIGVIAGGLLIVFSMWWIYFDYQVPHLLTSNRTGFIWGYGHLFVFAAVAAVGAGLGVAVDQAAGQSQLSDLRAGAVVAVPVAVYVLALWALHVVLGAEAAGPRFVAPLGAALVLLASASAAPVLLIGLILASMMAFKLVRRVRHAPRLLTAGSLIADHAGRGSNSVTTRTDSRPRQVSEGSERWRAGRPRGRRRGRRP
jgi:low temperature requirement protein LtrA